MTPVTPTIPPPEPDSLSSSLKRNIQALEDRRRQQAAAATREERIAEAITRFTGSMRFVYLHVVLFGAWFLVNLGIVPGVPRFDPSFVVLAMVALVEAIFLSTFVLISQNRMAAAADKRADLDLHISLLTQGQRMKSSSQKRQHVIIIPGSLLTTSAHADPSCSAATYEVDCDLAQDGQVTRGNPVTDAAVILTERDIQDPMEPIFDAPVSADRLDQHRWIIAAA